ncbi:putative membrane protein [Paenibacillus anaericanus]|uniref:DUF3139 domain-containing protein n=1 Tax=Paenibacillus anaericanus TaxID=170367 RepID=UPI0027830A7D|nr:DUF3139 domain-containing protein [Paenibacillus anaericanus]MDQ0088584.1 putative membrane protein [Paenibacillus anaericanus]
MMIIKNKKVRIIVIIMAILVALLVVTPVIYVQMNKIIYATRVTDYLLEEQNYSKAEIESVKGVWGIKLPAFYAIVTFKDEPYVEYVYFAHNEVLQFSYILNEEGLEEGIIESDLKHYDPFE